MILLVDNYDSFSYNLFQLIGSINPDIRVVRNDALSAPVALQLNPEAIILSPGPGRPEDAGICQELVSLAGPHVPILGVCLGHQAICQAYGATVTYAAKLMHGKQSMAQLDADCPLFAGLPEEVPVARYHSLAVDEATLPSGLRATAKTAEGEVMAVAHETHPVYGVQFHPESIMTPDGNRMLENFLAEAKRWRETQRLAP